MGQEMIDFDEERIAKEKALLFHVHEDIKEAATFYKIPLVYCSTSYVYILQADRCVYVGSRAGAINFIKAYEGIFCTAKYEPITEDNKKEKRVDHVRMSLTPQQDTRIDVKPVGVEVKRFILTRIIATLLYVPHYDIEVTHFMELKTCVRVFYYVAGEERIKQTSLPWWTLVTTTYDK
jgi:hypothetical protein